ncbi:MAG: hypothetical protein SGILL_007576, partial [Bacillariaceae sp.]
KDVQFVPEEGSDVPPPSEESWSCELSREDRAMYGVRMVGINGVTKEWIDSHQPESGTSVLIAREASIDSENGILAVSDGAQVDIVVQPEGNARRERKLAASTGNLKVLVVRVIASGTSPTTNKAQLIDDVFTDDANLQTQYEACSHGDLTIDPYVGSTDGPTLTAADSGVVDVSINADPTSTTRQTLESLAVAATEAIYGDL